MNTTRYLIGPHEYLACSVCRDVTWLAGPEERRAEEAAAFEVRHGHEVSKASPGVEPARKGRKL